MLCYNADDEISVYQLADAITARERFAKDAGGRLYIFRGGCYIPDGVPSVRRAVKRILNRLRLSSEWSSHKSEEVVKYIEVDSPLLWEKRSEERRVGKECRC